MTTGMVLCGAHNTATGVTAAVVASTKILPLTEFAKHYLLSMITKKRVTGPSRTFLVGQQP